MHGRSKVLSPRQIALQGSTRALGSPAQDQEQGARSVVDLADEDVRRKRVAVGKQDPCICGSGALRPPVFQPLSAKEASGDGTQVLPPDLRVNPESGMRIDELNRFLQVQEVKVPRVYDRNHGRERPLPDDACLRGQDIPCVSQFVTFGQGL